MSFAMIVYLIGMLDGFNDAVGAILIVSGISAGLSFSGFLLSYDCTHREAEKKVYDASVKAVRYSAIAASIALLLNLIVPSKEFWPL